jgi:hypothetical protein
MLCNLCCTGYNCLMCKLSVIEMIYDCVLCDYMSMVRYSHAVEVSAFELPSGASRCNTVHCFNGEMYERDKV